MSVVQPESYDAEALAAEFDVPRETVERLCRYAALVSEWQGRMNLVGPSTLPDIWSRHFRDSAQLLPLAPKLDHAPIWIDIGAGGGFPGLVVALLQPKAEVHLIESITKKATFLEAAIAELGLADRAFVRNARVESIEAFPADIITSRACANLAQLFDWGLRFAASSTCWLLPKGARHAEEIAEAGTRFAFDHELVPSRTDTQARIVVARNVRRRK